MLEARHTQPAQTSEQATNVSRGSGLGRVQPVGVDDDSNHLIGFAKDIELAAQLNISGAVPKLVDHTYYTSS